MIRALAICVVLAGCSVTNQVPIGAAASSGAPLPAGAIAGIPTRQNPKCFVTRIVDGDTIAIRCGAVEENARLMGFDTPETFRSGCAAEKDKGLQAKRYLETVLRAASVISPDYNGRDKYRRALVELTIDGIPLSRKMVDARMAVPYSGGKRINWCNRLVR